MSLKAELGYYLALFRKFEELALGSWPPHHAHQV